MKKITVLFLVCILSVLNIRAEVYSGSCGDKVNYSLDTSTGVLSITGTGAMTDYTFSSFSDVPWHSNRLYIKTVEMSDGVTTVGDWAFYDCSNLTSINIPNSVKSLGKMGFYNCVRLASIDIPNSVTSIGKETFRNCPSLSTITIPSSVTSILFNAFSSCYFEKKDFINNSKCNAESNSYWGATIVDSRENGFVVKDSTLILYTGNETSVTIPNSVTNIGKAAFQYCTGLTSVTIDSSVRTIEEKAIAGCQELTDVYCLAKNVPTTKSNAFEGSSIESATLHVPVSAIEQYKATDPWSQFGTTEGIVQDAIAEVKSAPVLIQTHGNTISIQGAAEGTPIAIYGIDGRQHATGFAENGCAGIDTSLRAGSVAVVKIGEKSVKVMIK